MATDPGFAATINNGSKLIGTAETNLQVPAQSQTILTAGASGTIIHEIDVTAASTGITPTTVAGLVYIFAHDGATAWLRDILTVTALAASATVAPFTVSKTYTNFFIKSGWTIRASQSIAGNASLLVVSVFGADE